MIKYEPKVGEVYKLLELRKRYGDCTLSELIEKLKGSNVHECPKCNGRGYVKVEYNGYPSGLPDSGFVHEAAYKDVECDVCKGIGYTAYKMHPRMIQDGWEEDK